jgi:hypothetical protein
MLGYCRVSFGTFVVLRCLMICSVCTGLGRVCLQPPRDGLKYNSPPIILVNVAQRVTSREPTCCEFDRQYAPAPLPCS